MVQCFNACQLYSVLNAVDDSTDESHPPAQAIGLHVGWGVSIPMVLSQPPESRITGVAVGRSHRAGITEDGKLIFWEVSWENGWGNPQKRQRQIIVSTEALLHHQ